MRLLYSILAIIGAIIAFGVYDINTKNIKAAEFTVHLDDTTEYIVMSGEIVGGDLYRFQQAVNDLQSTDKIKLFLNSPGGRLDTTLDIIEEMKKYNIQTIVSEIDECYSGCAVIWVHGDEVVYQENAKVGFHVGSISSAEYLDELLKGHGLFGFQTIMQNNFAYFIQYYSELPVKDPIKLAFNVATQGFDSENFYMVDLKDAVNIIGAKII